MTDKNKLILKRIIAIFVSFILAFALACLGLCGTAKLISSPDFVQNIINKTNYIGYAEEEIKEGLCDLAIPSGLPADFFSDKISSDTVSKLVMATVTKEFSHNGTAVDTAFLKEDFKKEITLWADENFVSIDDATTSAITLLTDECYQVVLRYANPEIFRYLGRLTVALSKVSLLGIIFTLFLCAFGLFFLSRLCEKKRFFFFVFVSFCSGGLLIGLIPLILLATNKISSIAILSKSLYAFICGFANSALTLLVLFGILFILISIIFVFFEKNQK